MKLRCPFVRIALILASAALPAAAQPPIKPVPTEILIRPAAAPVPALKYRIVPERRALVPGNAAVFYHRAIEMVIDRRRLQEIEARTPNAATPAPNEDVLSRWIGGPLRQIPRDQARSALQAYYGHALHEVELGARRQTCDWEFDLRDEGFDLLLSDIQEMRPLARLVALRARLAVLDGQTDEAVHWLQTGFVMARHASQGPSLIQAIIGCHMESLMARALEDLIQAPGTPSLYWALANRPRPFIDMAAAWDGERLLLERELPSLRELDGGPWTLEKARRFGDDFQRKLGSLTGSSALTLPAGASATDRAPRLEDLPPRLSLAGMVAKVYPDAKRALIAQGRPAAEVEAMPAIQVAVLFSYQAYLQLCDDVYKWTGLPYWQSVRGLQEAVRHSYSQFEATPYPLVAVFTSAMPSTNGARPVWIRVDRQLDALQCVEAIRLYAAAHDGAFPPSLEAIVEAPAPLDPATGKPFEYKANGTRAILEAPVPPGTPDHSSFRIRYELKLAP